MIANILTIAGSDSGGGAGIQADIKTISALGGYALSVVTAITAQNTRGVDAVKLVDEQLVRAQLRSVISDIRIDAVKIGMLGSFEIIQAVAEEIGELVDRHIPIILDPVMVAKSGDKLLNDDAVNALKSTLLPISTLVTPNLPEAAVLLNTNEAGSRSDMEGQSTSLQQLGVKLVLLKGGHLDADDSPDLLTTTESKAWYEGRRRKTQNTHGTGCTLSSAIATCLGQGMSVHQSIERSKAYIVGAIESADLLQVGEGHGPTNHFW